MNINTKLPGTGSITLTIVVVVVVVVDEWLRGYRFRPIAKYKC